MECRILVEAARTGNVESLHKLIGENSTLLADHALVSPHENPLHVATKQGKLDFVREMIRLKPESAVEPNGEGFRPLDMASALGHVEIVKELIVSTGSGTPGNDICRLKGKDGRTAIHYAVISGRLEVIDELLSFSGDCIADVTVLGETVLHLAVKYYKFEALRKLVEWLKKLGREEIVNWGDKDGNSILHLAASKKQHESVDFLLRSRISNTLKMNETNTWGLTAMDIMDLLMENPSDVKLREYLRVAGALRARDITTAIIPSTLAGSTSSPAPQVTFNVRNSLPRPAAAGAAAKEDWIRYFRFQKKRDSPSDTRNVLLVVAALIATVTFQAGVNPPSSFLAEKSQSNNATNTTSYAAPFPAPEHRIPMSGVVLIAGFSALGGVASSDWFLLGNSLGFAASVNVIIYLTSGFPFQREVHISIYSMMFAYGCSVNPIQPKESQRYLILGIAFLVPFLVRWPWRWAIKLWRYYKTEAGTVNAHR